MAFRKNRSKTTSELVTDLYHELLGREPDPEGFRYWSDVARLNGVGVVRKGIKDSNEYKHKPSSEPQYVFRGYEDHELDIISEFLNPHAAPQSGFVVDFMGGRIRTSSLWTSARKLDGQVTPLPIPSDFHSEAVEWIGVLKSVRHAKGQFVAMELGAGLGPWIVASGLAARSLGIDDIRLYAVEADPTHYQLMRQNLDDNGFPSDKHTLLQAAVGITAGSAKWPALKDSRDDWGSRPIDNHSGETERDYLGRQFNEFIDVEIVSFHDLLTKEAKWDLVHIDIQGEEFNICKAGLSDLCDRVHWLVLGTHSRLIDGQMIDLLYSAGWVLENEKPSKFRYDGNATCLEAMTYVDGVQVWRNPRMD